MKQSKRVIIMVLTAAILFCFCFAAFSVVSRADNTAPSLYVNDDVWYKAGIYPLKVFNTICVPISIFEQIKGVTVTFYENNTAMIYRNENCFISFDFNRNTASSQTNDRFYYKTYLEGNERYLPMLTVCAHLNLEYELYTSPIDGSSSVRICDGSQSKTFLELIERHNPGAISVATTPPPATETTTKHLDPVENAVFLSINGLGGGDRIPALLNLCREYNVTAAFFITPEELKGHPDLVLSILAGGHSLGFLVPMEHALETLAEANAELMSRFKMTTRLVRIADRAEVLPADDYALSDAGYSRWGSHIDLGLTEAEVRSALIRFRLALGEEGHIVLCAQPNGFNTVGYLREFFNSAQGKRLFFSITPAHFSPAQ